MSLPVTLTRIWHLTDVQPPDAAWAVYFDVIQRARDRGIEHAIGGGLAVAAYTMHRESTKDIDLYVRLEDRERMIQVVTESGLQDYYEVLPYDRNWIHRSYTGDQIIVDIMWAMPNQRAQVDSEWLSRARQVEIHGEPLPVLPPEELIWAKLYVLQRDRCDWPDVLNLIYTTFDGLDWDHLLRRVGDDAPLLGAVMTIFRWLCPERSEQLPERIRQMTGSVLRNGHDFERANLLDTRPWFIAGVEGARQGS